MSSDEIIFSLFFSFSRELSSIFIMTSNYTFRHLHCKWSTISMFWRLTWNLMMCRNWCKRNVRNGLRSKGTYITYQGTTGMGIKLVPWKKQWISTMWRNAIMSRYLMQIMSLHQIFLWEPSLSSSIIPKSVLFKHVGSSVSLWIKNSMHLKMQFMLNKV